MTLIVAGISTSGVVTLVSDTKLTWPADPRKTSQIWSEARPKVFVLRHDVAVGVAGDDFDGTCERLMAVRDASIGEILETARARDGADIIVASWSPNRLWRIRGGEVEPVTTPSRTWAGDHAAFERFRAWEDPRFGDLDDLGLQAPMQTLVSLDRVGTVGGYAARISSCDHGFGYRATPMSLAEPADGATFVVRPDASATLTFTLRESPFAACVLTGLDPTRGAFAFHVGHAGMGYVFTHERPWEQIRVAAESCAELIDKAQTELGQSIASPGGCPAART